MHTLAPESAIDAVCSDGDWEEWMELFCASMPTIVMGRLGWNGCCWRMSTSENGRVTSVCGDWLLGVKKKHQPHPGHGEWPPSQWGSYQSEVGQAPRGQGQDVG